jgi:hypothetical protein
MNKLALFFVVIVTTLSSCRTKVGSTTYYENNYKTAGREAHSGLGFEVPEKYPIEVLEGDAVPATAFESIEKLTLTDEQPLEKKQEVFKGAMLKRGNTYDQKKMLMRKIVEQAQELGASGVMNVNYKVFTSATTSGYILTATAFKYVLK